jgi:hypothetical protein
MEALLSQESTAIFISALQQAYLHLHTEREIRQKEWPQNLRSDLEFLQRVDPEWISRAVAWDHILFWFTRTFYKHLDQYRVALPTVTSTLNRIWDLRRRLSLDALLSSRFPTAQFGVRTYPTDSPFASVVAETLPLIDKLPLLPTGPMRPPPSSRQDVSLGSTSSAFRPLRTPTEMRNQEGVILAPIPLSRTSRQETTSARPSEDPRLPADRSASATAAAQGQPLRSSAIAWTSSTIQSSTELGERDLFPQWSS